MAPSSAPTTPPPTAPPTARRPIADPTYGPGAHRRLGPPAHPGPRRPSSSRCCGSRWRRLPRRETPPEPLWLAWHGATSPRDLSVLWRWYERRFAVEHAVPLPQAGPGLDHGPARVARGRRPLELAAGGGECGNCGWRGPVADRPPCPGSGRGRAARSPGAGAAGTLRGLLRVWAPRPVPPNPAESRPDGGRGSVRAPRRASRSSAEPRPRPPEPPVAAIAHSLPPRRPDPEEITLSKLKSE